MSIVSETSETKPKKLSFEVIRELKKAGFDKPADVSWPDWMGPKKLSDRHKLIAIYRAKGVNARTIANELGFTESRLSLILNTQRMQEQVEAYRQQYYGQSIQKRFHELTDKAVDVLEETINNPQERTSVKLKAVNEVLNRSLGKPKEQIEIKTSTVRDLFEELDKLRRGELTLDFSAARPKSIESSDPNIIDTTATRVDQYDSTDEWIEQNIPAEVGIGVKGKPDTDEK